MRSVLLLVVLRPSRHPDAEFSRLRTGRGSAVYGEAEEINGGIPRRRGVRARARTRSLRLYSRTMSGNTARVRLRFIATIIMILCAAVVACEHRVRRVGALSVR